jgi:hypothetical protein
MKDFGELVTVKKDSDEFENELVLKRIGYRVHSMVKVKGLRGDYKFYDVEFFDTKDITDKSLYKKMEDRILEDMEIVGVIFEIYRLYENNVVLFKEVCRTEGITVDDLRDAYGMNYINFLSDREEKRNGEKKIKIDEEAVPFGFVGH